MLKRILIATTLGCAGNSNCRRLGPRGWTSSAHQKAAHVFQEIMSTPDHGIPSESSGIGQSHRHHSRG